MLRAVILLSLQSGQKVLDHSGVFNSDFNIDTASTRAQYWGKGWERAILFLRQVFGIMIPSHNRKTKTNLILVLLNKGVLHPWNLFLKAFSKNKATLDKVSNGSDYKCSNELKNKSFISVETMVVKLL